MANARDLIFIDVETTGLELERHELIEVGWVHCDPSGQIVKNRYTAKLRPRYIETATAEALAVNGYNEADWAPEACTSPESVARSLEAASDACVLVGHNVSFDENFLEKLLQSKPWWYHKVDTVSLAWPLYLAGKLTSLSLAKVAPELGIEYPAGPHRALQDAEVCRQVYLTLMSRYLTN